MGCWAYCKEESEFYPIFGSNPVPIRSIVPIIPREPSCPPCYVVLTTQLSSEQFNALAQKLLEKWYPECTSIEVANNYLIDGLPLKTTHFNGCGSDDLYMVPTGAAINIAIRSQAEENEN